MRPNNEILIDYLDNTMDQQQSAELENAMRDDRTMEQDYQYLLLARETIQLNAINQKVLSVRQSLEKTTISKKTTPGVLHSFHNIGLRVAAAIILLMGITLFYKYASVNSESVYGKQFIGYELSNPRGANTSNVEEESYQDKNWQAVITNYQSTIHPGNKQSFLAGMAEMQLNHFPQAIALFENILNSKSDNGFREEAEYYVSLAYLKNHETGKAIQMIDQIKSNPNHTYFPFADKVSDMDLKILELKK